MTYLLGMFWLGSCADAGNPSEEPMTEAVGAAPDDAGRIEPAPWEIRFADGSGNVTRLWRVEDDPVVRFEYHPVTPERSSSGTYSGGEPAAGPVAEARVLALWAEARRLQATPSVRAERREMGTGVLTVTTGVRRTTVLVRRDAVGPLTRQMSELRAPPPP